ncbi:MAG: peptide deformylase [Proteobacteria bacterium]|nr:peptide deformylase [Pseudomonadota bacterium]NBP14621.1 peptide deformylase [bacterium]
MLNIVHYPDPILAEKMPNFDFAHPIMDPEELEKVLIETMFKNNGIGLSANQVGIRTRVFVMGTKHGPELTRAYFNPQVLNNEEDYADLPEGCLSFPNIFVKVKRPLKITCSWQNTKGEFQIGDFQGYGCKCFLHELDHLDGFVFKDKVSRLKWDLAIKKAKRKK